MSSKISLCHYSTGHLGLRNETKLLLSFTTILALLGFTQMSNTPQAFAATVESNGSGGGLWHVGSSWSGGNVPNASDDVIIKDGDTIILELNYTHKGDVTIKSGAKLFSAPASGELTTLDKTSPLLAGTYSTAAWLIPIIVAFVGVGIYLVKRKF